MLSSQSRQPNAYYQPTAAPPQPPKNEGGPSLPPTQRLHDSSNMMPHMPPHLQAPQGNLMHPQQARPAQSPQHQQPPQQQQQATPQQQAQQQMPQQQQQQQQQVAQQHAPPRIEIYIGQRNGRSYRLSVEQQPVRARMCGFGDKDRRPITPPPCIRLVVCDIKTGQEVPPNDVDSTFFVLMVDLWSEDGLRAVNLVRHSSAAPTVSISSSTTAAFPPPPERGTLYMQQQQYAGYGPPMPPRALNPYGAHQAYYAPGPVNPEYPLYPGAPAGYNPIQVTGPIAAPSITQNHTRNLIGMNAVNACRLNDPDGNPGFWFVLQDLSVRTEGTFRLKLSMCDIGSSQSPTAAVVSNGKCPILASTFSEAFTVYSAKKFPGVIESTPLSKCFASQGIKIPIRKDGVKERGNQAEYDNDD